MVMWSIKCIFALGVNFLLILNGIRFSCSQSIDFFFFPTAREGEFVHMYCFCNHFQSNTTSAILKDDIILASGIVVDENFENRPGTFLNANPSSIDLGFFAERSDEGMYKCCVYNGNPLQVTPVSCSDSRQLNIAFLSYPLCKPAENLRIHCGEEAILSCLSDGKPPVTLKWSGTKNYVNSTSLGNEIITTLGGNVTSGLILNTTDEDINNIFTCTASNDYFERTCQITVKTVWPILTISPNEIVTNVNESVEFTCSAIDFNPNWEWDTKPALSSSRVTISANVFRFTEVTLADNDTVINCYGLSENRWFHASAVLFVRTDSSSTGETTSKQAGDNAVGWKAGFTIVFIIMVALIAVIVFLARKLCDTATTSAIAVHHPKDPAASKQADPSEEAYTELQKPAEGKKVGYSELMIKTGSSEQNLKNDFVYEVDVVAEEQENPDEIYDYAEN